MNKDHNHIIHITKTVSQNRLDREFDLLDSIELLGESLDIYINGKTPSMDNQIVLVVKSEPNPKTNRYEEIFIMVLLNKNDFYDNYSDDVKKIADSTDTNVLQLHDMEYSNSDFVNSKLPLIIYKLLEKNNFDVYIGDKVVSDASDPSQEKLVNHLIDKTKEKLSDIDENNLLERIVELGGIKKNKKKLSEMPQLIRSSGSHVPAIKSETTFDIDKVNDKSLLFSLKVSSKDVDFWFFKYSETDQWVVFGIERKDKELVFQLSFYRTPNLPPVAVKLSNNPRFLQVEAVATSEKRRGAELSVKVYHKLASHYIICSDVQQTGGGKAIWLKLFEIPRLNSLLRTYLLTKQGVVATKNNVFKDIRFKDEKSSIPMDLLYHSDADTARSNLFLFGRKDILDYSIKSANIPIINDKEFRTDQRIYDQEWQENRRQQMFQQLIKHVPAAIKSYPNISASNPFSKGYWPNIIKYLIDNVSDNNYQQSLIDLINYSYSDPENSKINIFYDIKNYPVSNIKLENNTNFEVT